MSAAFFAALKNSRKGKNLKQKDMAGMLGVSLTQYQNYEYSTLPPHEKLLEINKLLEVDLSRFIYQELFGNEPGAEEPTAAVNSDLRSKFNSLEKKIEGLSSTLAKNNEMLNQMIAYILQNPVPPGAGKKPVVVTQRYPRRGSGASKDR